VNEKDLSSEELLQGFVSGQNACLQMLYARHAEGLEKFVYQELALEPDWIRSRQADVCNQVWLEVARSAKNFQGRSSFWTWLCAIAHRAAFKHAERLEGTKHRQADTGVFAVKELATAAEVEAPKALVEREFKTDLDRAVAELPTELRSVFVLRAQQELTWEQIVAILGRPKATLEYHLLQATRALRERLRRHAPKGSTRGAA
jgi:RNA polymerase sigma-70 factor (ECF subfamily)